jgi:trans-2-enoyl-CoA reductase
MKAIQYFRHGAPDEVLQVTDVVTPHPSAGEVRIRLEASPVHLADLKHIRGEPWFDQFPPPQVPGYEGVGRISAVGDDVEPELVGRRVFLPIGFGAWQEERLAPAQSLWFAPQSLAAEQLALIPINFSTAWLLLRSVLSLQAGDWVLQNAASSNVGYYLIRLCRRRGLRTINVVRRAQHLDHLYRAGGDINLLDGDDLASRVRASLGGGRLRLAIDAIAGDATTRLGHCLDTGGVIVNYGTLSAQPCRVPGEMLFLNDITLRGFFTARASQQLGADALQAMRHDIAACLIDDPPQAPIAACYRFDQVAQAVRHASLAGAERAGKIVLLP